MATLSHHTSSRSEYASALLLPWLGLLALATAGWAMSLATVLSPFAGATPAACVATAAACAIAGAHFQCARVASAVTRYRRRGVAGGAQAGRIGAFTIAGPVAAAAGPDAA